MTARRTLAFLALLLSAAPLAAAPSSRGLRLPGASVVEGDGAAAISLNPAGLGFLQGLEASYVHTDLDALQGSGDGLFLASHVMGPLAIGAGFEFLPFAGVAERVFRFSFAAALALDRVASLGVGVHRFVSDESGALDGTVSLDLGLMVRPLSWLALGLSVEDLNTPVFFGRSARRLYQAGLAFRPGTDRVVLGLEAHLEERSWTYGGRLRMSFEPTPGLLIGALLGASPHDGSVALELGTHLSLSLGYASATGGVFLAGQDDLGFNGYTVGLSATTRRRASLYERHGQVVALTLGGSLPEQARQGLFTSRRATFAELVLALDTLRQDPRVDGLLLRLRGLSAGWAQVQELRRLLAELRAAGKKVIVHTTMPDTREYYLASESDLLLIQPGGVVLLTGLNLVRTYLKGLLDKVGVAAQFVAIGDYKSAPEMFTREGPSAPSEQASEAILDGIYAQVIEGLAQSRGRSAEELRGLVDGGPWAAARAESHRLVDGIAHEEDLDERLSALFGHPVNLREDWFTPREQDTRWGPDRHVAIVTIDGAMTDGNSQHIPLLDITTTGARSVAETLGKVAADPAVLGILLRVRSGGGSAQGAERIHRAVAEAARHKPLAVSFGDLAASGGYYAGCGAERIFAEQATLTGSIGIFAGKFVLTGLYDLLGIHRDLRKRGARGAFLSLDEAWSEDDLAHLRAQLQSLYELFLQRVAEGRKLAPEAVTALAQGRVWLGAEVLDAGLIDEHGGVREALRWLAARAGASDAQLPAIRHYPGPAWWAKLGIGAQAAAPGAPEATEPLLAALADERPTLPLPGALRAGAELLAPLLLGERDGAPLAMWPVQLTVE